MLYEDEPPFVPLLYSTSQHQLFVGFVVGFTGWGRVVRDNMPAINIATLLQAVTFGSLSGDGDTEGGDEQYSWVPGRGDGLGERFIDAWLDRMGLFIESVIDAGSDIVIENVGPYFEFVISVLLWTPTPAPDRALFEEPQGGIWGSVIGPAADIATIATTIFFLVFVVAVIFNAMVDTSLLNSIYARGFFVFLILLTPNGAYELSFVLLEITNAITMTFAPNAHQLSEAIIAQIYDPNAANNLILSFIFSFAIVIIGVLLGVIAFLRATLVILLTLFMPILLVLWVFKGDGALGTFGSIGQRGMSLLVSVAIFPIFVAISFAIGVDFLTIESGILEESIMSPVSLGGQAFEATLKSWLGFGIIVNGTVIAILVSRLGSKVVKATITGGAATAVGVATGNPIAAAGVASSTARKAQMASHYGGGGSSYESKNTTSETAGSDNDQPKDITPPDSNFGDSTDSETTEDSSPWWEGGRDDDGAKPVGEGGGGNDTPSVRDDPLSPVSANAPSNVSAGDSADSAGGSQNGDGPFVNPSPTPHTTENEHVQETTSVPWYSEEGASTPEVDSPPFVGEVRGRKRPPNADLPSVTYTSDTTSSAPDTGMSEGAKQEIREDIEVNRSSWVNE